MWQIEGGCLVELSDGNARLSMGLRIYTFGLGPISYITLLHCLDTSKVAEIDPKSRYLEPPKVVQFWRNMGVGLRRRKLVGGSYPCSHTW